MGGRKYRRGDVVIVPVRYATPPGSKVRPAVIVSSDTYHAAQSANVVIARLSGNIAMHQTATGLHVAGLAGSGTAATERGNLISHYGLAL